MEMSETLDPHITMCYKHHEDSSILLDFYPPPLKRGELSNDSPLVIPSIVYFHGGGLTVGNRQSWFPTWLQKRASERGYAFISADYRLIPPATGHEIVEDILDLFAFLEAVEVHLETSTGFGGNYEVRNLKIDTNAIAVAGTSSGGLCAYLAAIHCKSPKPRAILSLYGMGGHFLTPHYFTPKGQVFFRGRELLEPIDFAEYYFPFPAGLNQLSDSPLSYHSADYHIPGYPANQRMLLARLYLQLGTFIDYYTGQHEPSLSGVLREVATKYETVQSLDLSSTWKLPYLAEMKRHIPESHIALFPQFCVSSSWPPTLLLHGSADSAVLLQESQNMYNLLIDAGVPVELITLEGKEHSFDYANNAQVLFEEEFDKVINFINECFLHERV